jgi:hypothetical protein
MWSISWTGGADLRSVQLDPGVHPAVWEGHRPIPLVVPVHVPPKDDVPLGGQLPQSCASLQQHREGPSWSSCKGARAGAVAESHNSGCFPAVKEEGGMWAISHVALPDGNPKNLGFKAT